MVKKRVSGSFTVEAAFIIPLIIFLIFCFLYLALDLHDRVTLSAMINRYGLQIQDELRIHEKTILEKQLVQQIKEEAKDRLCITDLKKVTAKAGLLTIHVEYEGYRRLSLPVIKTILGDNRRFGEEDIVIYDPMKAVRSLGGLLNDDSGI